MAKIQNEKTKLRVLFNQLQVQRSPGYSLTGQPMHFHTKWAARKLARLGLGSYDYDSSMQQLTYQLVAVQQLLQILPHFAGPRFLPSCSPLPNQRVASQVQTPFAASFPVLINAHQMDIQLIQISSMCNYSFLEKNVMSSFGLAYLDLGFIAEEITSENKFVRRHRR